MSSAERNRLILLLVAKREHSYEVIAKLMHCTRGVVAGVVFRDKYPQHKRQRGGTCIGGHNMMGHGWQPATYRPEKTIADIRG